MKIEHIAMYVNNLSLNKEFYVKFFNATSNDLYHNPTTGLRTYFLTFENGARLEIMNRPNMVDEQKELMRTGLIHLAFSVGSKEKVDSLTKEIVEAGYPILSGPRTTGDGYCQQLMTQVTSLSLPTS
ncbi:VOC family protein [Paenibacillus medicaginis]|uniref:VOC family protein n=1 Tax=Paenibacillus medicaginis TaxID=1470560 RepID=A0ABV5C159_9BACL